VASAVLAGAALVDRGGFDAGFESFFGSSGKSTRLDDSRSWRVTASTRWIAASSNGVDDAAGDNVEGD